MAQERAGRLITEVEQFGLRLAVAPLLIIVLVVVRLTFGWAVTEPAQTRLQEGLLVLADADRSLLTADAALRGLLATGDPAFADRVRAGLPALAATDPRLSATLVDPQQRLEIVELVRAEERWRTGWVDPALAAAASGTPASGTLQSAGATLVADYLGASDTLRSSALAEVARNDRDASIVSWGVGAAVLIVGLVALGLAVRGRRRLVRRVVAPVDDLLGAVREISQGRLQPPPAVSGSAELVDLRDGLVDMTEALRRQREDAAAQAERLRAQGDSLRTVLEMAREIAGSLNTRYVVASTVQAAVVVTGGAVLLWLLDDDGGGLELAYDAERGPVAPLERQCSLGIGLVGRCARYGQISRGQVEAGDEAAVAVPLVVGARVIGVLECADGPYGPVDDESLSAVEMLATLAGSAIEASRLHAATERLSQFDPLTQLANRRRLGVELAGAVANAVRHDYAMSVIMIDLDHFKELNDRYGHQQGDVVLQEFAVTMQATMRTGETAYRYGGEEFVIVVTHGDGQAASVLAERLRARVESEFHRGGRQLVTASFGIAALPDDADDADTLVAAADRALYAAKHAGRNRVHRAGQPARAATASPMRVTSG